MKDLTTSKSMSKDQWDEGYFRQRDRDRERRGRGDMSVCIKQAPRGPKSQPQETRKRKRNRHSFVPFKE